MLDETETYDLVAIRSAFYAKAGDFGDVFDSNLVDALSCSNTTFSECLKQATEDTNKYIFLEESIIHVHPHTSHTTRKHLDS